MIFSGAMAEAANAMRRIQRGINRRVSLSLRRARARGARDYGTGYEPARVDFPCMYLCGTCGYFVDEPPVGENDEREQCPACNDGEWIDLAIEEMADRTRDIEAEERMKAPKHIRSLVRVWLPLLVLGVIICLMIVGQRVSKDYYAYAFYTFIASIFLVPLAGSLLPRWLSVLLLRFEERPPHRWHVPLSLPEPERSPSRRHEGLEATPVGETLTAPISGKECLAYQVSVLFDTPGDARPPEWALQEQRAVGVRLGEELTVEPDALYLESKEEQIDTLNDAPTPGRDEEKDRHYASLKKFLRQRGLFVTEGEFQLFEARLEPGERVDVSDYDGKIYVLTHAEAAPNA